MTSTGATVPLLPALMNKARRRVEGVMNYWVISDVWHALSAGQILGEFGARICGVLLSVITNMTSSWEHIGTERL